MVGPQYGELNALPPSKWLQLTFELVTLIACAKGAPNSLSAELGC